MSYTDLVKLYYTDRTKYEEEYQRRFHSEYAQHIDFPMGDFPAFFVVTPEIQALMLSIQRADKQVLACCDKLPEVALRQFMRRCLIDEIVITNNIEGVHSTRKEIDGLLMDLGKNDRHKRFKGLVQKYAMLQTGGEMPLRTCEDVRRIYDDLALDEVVADHPENAPDGIIFRKGPVSVQSAAQKELHKGLYPEEAIISAMTQALNFLNDGSVELLYRVAVFHYLLGYIHPFYDGNGRLNRFISSYLLSKELQPALSYRLSFTIKENISKYYNAFKTCNKRQARGDLTPFVEMFLRIIEESSQQLLVALRERSEALAYYYDNIGRFPHAEKRTFFFLYYFLIQAELFSEEGISTQDLLLGAELSRATLRKKLEMMEQAGVLKVRRQKSEKRYGLNLEKLDEYIRGKT